MFWLLLAPLTLKIMLLLMLFCSGHANVYVLLCSLQCKEH